jgi:hypothetical protein
MQVNHANLYTAESITTIMKAVEMVKYYKLELKLKVVLLNIISLNLH